jgi:hypothetical protein
VNNGFGFNILQIYIYKPNRSRNKEIAKRRAEVPGVRIGQFAESVKFVTS